jgi:hypothetical protein
MTLPKAANDVQVGTLSQTLPKDLLRTKKIKPLIFFVITQPLESFLFYGFAKGGSPLPRCGAELCILFIFSSRFESVILSRLWRRYLVFRLL